MGWCPPPFPTPPAFLHLYSWEDLLDLENEKYVVSLSFFWAGLSSSQLLALSYLGVAAHTGQISAAQPGAHLYLLQH